MFQFAKLIFYLLRELIFDNKEEYDYKSAKFNARKFIILIIIMLSIFMNIWMLYRFVLVSGDIRQYRTDLEACQKTCTLQPP